MAERISFGDTLILKGEKLLIDNDTSDGIIKSKNGTVKIEGNLTVSGTTTTVESETVTIADNILLINSNVTGTPSEDGGIEIERGTSSNKSLTWNETDDKWTVGAETFVATTFEGNLTGNITGDVTGDITSTGTSTFSDIDINGGNIDSTVIGSTTPVVGTFTTLTATTINGPLTGTVTGTVSSISNHDTDALSEGSTNLYFADSRVDTHLNQSNPTSGSVLSWNGADYSWASPLLFDKQFSSLEAVPTTIAGYGITDGYANSDVASYLGGNLDTHILPDTNDTYDIGSATHKIRDLYVSDNSLHIGSNTLKTSGTNLLFNDEDIMDYANIKSKPTTLAGYGITDGGSGGGGAYALGGYTEIPSIRGEIEPPTNYDSIDSTEYQALTVSGTMTKLIDTNKNTVVDFKLLESGKNFTVTPTESASTLEVNIFVPRVRNTNTNIWGNISPSTDNGDGTWSPGVNNSGWIPVIYKDSDIVSNVLTTWIEPQNTADIIAKTSSTWNGGDFDGWRFTETPGNTSSITYKLGWIVWKENTVSGLVNVSDYSISDAHVKDIRIQANSSFSGAYGDLTGKPTIVAEQDFEIHTADFNATSGSRHAVDTSSAVVTATLPASPATGDAIFFADAGENYATNNLTIARNGNTIMGSATDMTVSTNNQSFGLFYNGSTWRIY